MAIDTTRFSRFVDRGQEGVRAAVDTWTRTVTAVADQLTAVPSQADLEAAVDFWFDLFEIVVRAQREFAKTMVGYVGATGADLVERAGAVAQAAARTARSTAA
jgi:hypothetical protein